MVPTPWRTLVPSAQCSPTAATSPLSISVAGVAPAHEQKRPSIGVPHDIPRNVPRPPVDLEKAGQVPRLDAQHLPNLSGLHILKYENVQGYSHIVLYFVNVLVINRGPRVQIWSHFAFFIVPKMPQKYCDRSGIMSPI